MRLAIPLLCEILWRITRATRWFIDHLHDPEPGPWRYRYGLWVHVNAHIWEDRRIGLREFPHFQAAEDRVFRGQSIMWPNWETWEDFPPTW